MPPRVRFTPDRILDGALALLRREGLDALTARRLSKDLGCSTAPLFRAFESMEALEGRVIDAVIADFIRHATAHPHDDPIVAVGLGWLAFAAEEPRLYEALFLRHHPWHHRWGPVRRRLATEMAAHPRYAALDEAARFALVGRASIVLHGLGLELWSGRLVAADRTARLDLIDQLVGPAVDAAIAHAWTTDFHSRRDPSSGARRTA